MSVACWFPVTDLSVFFGPDLCLNLVCFVCMILTTVFLDLFLSTALKRFLFGLCTSAWFLPLLRVGPPDLKSSKQDHVLIHLHVIW